MRTLVELVEAEMYIFTKLNELGLYLEGVYKILQSRYNALLLHSITVQNIFIVRYFYRLNLIRFWRIQQWNIEIY